VMSARISPAMLSYSRGRYEVAARYAKRARQTAG
jgi:hypothetical protein